MASSGRIGGLFVGNLPWTVGHRQLREYFSQFGHINSARVIFDKSTGLSKGYGFVEFANQGSLNDVTNKQVHSLEGNNLVVQNQNN